VWDLFLKGENNYHITIWPFGAPTDSDIISKAIIPYLPIKERDHLFWEKVAKRNNLTLSEAKSEENGRKISYEVSIKNPNVSSLRFSSNPNHGLGNLCIEADFQKPVTTKEFRRYDKFWGGSTTITLNEKYVSEGDLKGKHLRAEIHKLKNYLAADLIAQITSN